MELKNIIRVFRQAGIHTLTCPVGDCDYHDRPMSLRGWFNHLRGAHLKPRPEVTCPHCGTTGRDPGMWHHIKVRHPDAVG